MEFNFILYTTAIHHPTTGIRSSFPKNATAFPSRFIGKHIIMRFTFPPDSRRQTKEMLLLMAPCMHIIDFSPFFCLTFSFFHFLHSVSHIYSFPHPPHFSCILQKYLAFSIRVRKIFPETVGIKWHVRKKGVRLESHVATRNTVFFIYFFCLSFNPFFWRAACSAFLLISSESVALFMAC